MNGPVDLRRPTPTPWLRHASHFVALLGLAGLAFTLALPDAPLATLPAGGTLALLYAGVVALNFWQIGLTTWSSVLGGMVAIWQRRRGSDRGGPMLRPPTGRARTAVLLPAHEEDALRLFALAATTADALDAERENGVALGVVDLFVLSDTRSPLGVAAEEQVARRLATRADGAPIFYRRRTQNDGRKAGNIADFFARWGGAYDFLLVLDADSLMSGPAIGRLIGAMEANPNAGLIQAMCYALGRSTLFARLQQFSARLYGPAFQRGVAFWQGPRGNFWGHNAILRADAFAASCGLPVLPGPPPFGGEIMSHDTVEAALMLRAGYDVWMLPDGVGASDRSSDELHDKHAGSWEETPTNLADHLGRDRRWCQGNLQHVRVLRASGLKLASYYHLTRGLLHYLYVVPFLAWLVLYAALDRPRSTALIALWLGMLAIRRVIGLVEALREDPAGFGGALALCGSAALDSLIDALNYSVLVTFHTLFLAAALAGHTVRWDVQSRDDRDLDWAQAWGVMGRPLAGALVLLALLAPFAPLVAALLAPGLLLAIPFAVWSSRRDVGAKARRLGLFLTPDELRPPLPWLALKRTEAALAAATAESEPPRLPPERARPLVIQRLRRQGTSVAAAAAS